MEKSAGQYMHQALELAQLAWGETSPNPLVGAIVVKNGRIIGRGHHRKAGTPHAEINALADCRYSPAGATLYVTLEPCSTHGRTPPCTDAIIKAGIKKVYIGCLDPNPNHAGRGVEILQQAGIEVVFPVMEQECRRLNEAFFKWITTREPFVILKMAMTLDGRIATVNGNSQWVTGPEARERVQTLRQWADAVMVGGETARLDRPGLNVRCKPDWEKQPRRIIVSRRIRPEEAEALLQPGVRPEVIAPQTPEEWHIEMSRLGSEGVTALLIEGGGELAGTVLQAGIVDKVEFFIAPKILGGRDSRCVVGGENPLSLSEAMNLDRVEIETIGNDLRVSGYIAAKG